MRLKKYQPWLIALVIFGIIFILKTRTTDIPSTALTAAQVTGPAVILFRGDNSPSCQAIYRLVDEAEQRYNSKVDFQQLDWSADNPFIKHYQVRFLPTVLLIDSQGKEVDRIIGESPAVQAKLKDRLAQLTPLLMQ
jgi:thioredoxin-like negative regulator of GroEL